jgi:hypothetical protein
MLANPLLKAKLRDAMPTARTSYQEGTFWRQQRGPRRVSCEAMTVYKIL